MSNYAIPDHFVKVANRFESALLPVNEIRYLQQEDRRIRVHLSDDSKWECCSMEDILERLGSDLFVRCHHSLVVNIDRVVKFKDNRQIVLDNGRVLTMCRAAVLKTKKVWKDYYYNY